ncbi:MAG: hypothetical protein AUJ92_21375 [Armatimonadetes bacterium CG2_30_59_28]|nr:hypothetical protein [Armatimonadota bacterium]OIO89481.1 MAG: hypothetical protein AUJ92_21375 [Armatimonadetes bacterium CG2_30_59_28]PIU66117.1 MAG: hypothetical protein COS85_06140 [Armatimonadetes bacterium CG07_land_8_20_14_0_80_59_28]PIX41913.1 MAG: hypothetical protein COZ56_10710 [Armatimonadetes bacterium CG_4_8_14_3_um_filter_58_9]PIY43017.1 MAG: hypothetical protein COZ05_12535 [Armatimonadetes bacterium CG_4_10_14_3_um_filter_59_10]PJB62786.1 MAG: hypothetical protein CO095_178
MSRPAPRVVEFFSGPDDLSDQQREILRKMGERFPELTVDELPLDSDKARERGIPLAPGLVIDGVILGVGSVVSAGRIRRYLQPQQE